MDFDSNHMMLFTTVDELYHISESMELKNFPKSLLQTNFPKFPKTLAKGIFAIGFLGVMVGGDFYLMKQRVEGQNQRIQDSEAKAGLEN